MSSRPGAARKSWLSETATRIYTTQGRDGRGSRSLRARRGERAARPFARLRRIDAGAREPGEHDIRERRRDDLLARAAREDAVLGELLAGEGRVYLDQIAEARVQETRQPSGGDLF